MNDRRPLLSAPMRCLLSGLLYILSYPHADLGWLIWIALIPFLSIFPCRSYAGAGGAGFLFGLAAYGGLLYWVEVFAAHIIGAPLAVAGWFLAAFAQAIVVVAFGLGAQWLSGKGPACFLVGVPALWTVLEWIRQLGPLGVGWGDLAYTQHSAPIVLMLTRFTGIWGLSWLIVTVNAGLLLLLRKEGSKALHVGWVGVTAAALVYGAVVYSIPGPRPTVTVAALQPDVDLNVSWNGIQASDPDYVARTVQILDEQLSEAKAHGAVFSATPETFFPGYIEGDGPLRSKLDAGLAATGQTLAVGDNDFDPSQDRDANAVYSVWPDGSLHGVYMKRELVPFGEFTPFRNIFPFLEALHVTVYDRKVGPAVQPLLDAGPAGKLAVAICYESSYPELTREQVARGANVLLIVTDDSWFGKTAAARQHAAIASVRAAETDRYVVRSADTGISEIIDPRGRVIAEAGLFRRAVVTGTIAPMSDSTFYVRHGDWFVGLCWVLFAMAAGRRVPRTRA